MRNRMRRSQAARARGRASRAAPGSAAHRVDDARKLREQAVAGGLDDTAPMFRDLGVDQLPTMRLQPFERALLVRTIRRE